MAGDGGSAEPDRGDLIAMELVLFFTSFSGVQGNLVLNCLAVSSPGSLLCLPACPGSADVPAHGNGDAKQVPLLYETPTFVSTAPQPNISSTTFYY